MNRDPNAWARLGRALRSAREHRGLTQQELGEMAGTSGRSVQDAEAGQVPKSRMPYTLGRIASALGWPEGAVTAVLDGEAPPGEGWRDVPVQPAIDEERLESIITNAMVRATEHATAAEIRAATKIALDELRRQGLL
jgi:transcriptional regulator with XRE-family HTH domain